MASKKQSRFWIKHLVLALIVLAIALLVLLYRPESLNSSIRASGQESSKGSSIEENLANFYREFRLSSRDPIQEEFGEYVIALEESDASQTQQLNAISSVDYPPEESWEGTFKYRSFAKDNTLRTEAIKYTEEEGMQLIWSLSQDYIIRDRFLSENSLIGTLQDVAGAIDSNFISKVEVYFCNKKRAIVITDNADTYVKENCKEAGAY
jgi:hypothetical protein